MFTKLTTNNSTIPKPRYYFAGVTIPKIDLLELSPMYTIVDGKLLFNQYCPVIDFQSNSYIIVRYDDHPMTNINVLQNIVEKCTTVNNLLGNAHEKPSIFSGLLPEINQGTSKKIEWHGHKLIFCKTCKAYELAGTAVPCHHVTEKKRTSPSTENNNDDNDKKSKLNEWTVSHNVQSMKLKHTVKVQNLPRIVDLKHLDEYFYMTTGRHFIRYANRPAIVNIKNSSDALLEYANEDDATAPLMNNDFYYDTSMPTLIIIPMAIYDYKRFANSTVQNNQYANVPTKYELSCPCCHPVITETPVLCNPVIHHE